MYKKAVAALVLAEIFFGVLCMILLVTNKEEQPLEKTVFEVELNQVMLANEKEYMVEISGVRSSKQRVLTYAVLDKAPVEVTENVGVIAVSLEDYENLLRIVEAEAGGEDEIGKILVANVILNRVECDSFPNTVSEVIFQQSNGVCQFSPVGDGRFYTVKVSEATIQAVNKALAGEDYSQGALYFAARKYADSSCMRWFDESLIFLFEHGGHEFFTQ